MEPLIEREEHDEICATALLAREPGRFGTRVRANGRARLLAELRADTRGRVRVS